MKELTCYDFDKANEAGYQAYVEMKSVLENPYYLATEFELYVEWLSGYRNAIVDEDEAIFGEDGDDEE